MKVKIWGVRGSLPRPYRPDEVQDRIRSLLYEFVEQGGTRESVDTFLKQQPVSRFGGYGGNTPCLEVFSDKGSVIIDAGSGIREVGYHLMKGPCAQGKGEAHLLFTHFHWDHLIGLPFFTPIFVPGNKIHVYAVQDDLKQMFETVFQKPYFPVPLSDLGAKIIFHELEPRVKRTIGDLNFTPYQLDHPDPCWGYRFEHKGRAFAHCVDTECTRVSPSEMGDDLPLYQNVNLMVFDAQYTLMETIEKINWGHAAASIGIDIAIREGVERVLFMHHDPASTDQKIAAAEAEARRYFNTQIKQIQTLKKPVPKVDWVFAHEGMVVEV